MTDHAYDLCALQVATLLRVNQVLNNIELYYPSTFEELIFSEGALWYATQVQALGIIETFDNTWVRDRMNFILQDRAWETLSGLDLNDYYRKAGRLFITEFHAEYGIDSPIDPLFTAATQDELQQEMDDVLRDNPEYFTTL